MNSSQECLACERCAARNPEQFSAMLCNPQFVGVPVILPEPNICGSGGKGYSLLAISKQAFEAQSSTPLNQQRANQYRLQADNEERAENGAAILVPDGRILEHYSCAGRQVIFAQVPLLHRPIVDAVVLSRICSRRKRRWSFPVQDFDRQVARRNAYRPERFNEAAAGSLPTNV